MLACTDVVTLIQNQDMTGPIFQVLNEDKRAIRLEISKTDALGEFVGTRGVPDSCSIGGTISPQVGTRQSLMGAMRG